MILISYDALHLMKPALYSHRKLSTKPLDIDVLIVALTLVRVHQLHSFEHSYERGETDM